MPQIWLWGYWISPVQRRWSQVSPGDTQVPQLALQQSSPTLQVFLPQTTLLGTTGMPQTSWSQVCPGSVQVPQLALQQTLPGGHVVLPHGGPAAGVGAFAAVRVGEASGGAASETWASSAASVAASPASVGGAGAAGMGAGAGAAGMGAGAGGATGGGAGERVGEGGD
jgi:hypothetical protein